jgi:multidrug efflux system outer membrane protein
MKLAMRSRRAALRLASVHAGMAPIVTTIALAIVATAALAIVLTTAGCTTVGPDYQVPASAAIYRPGASAPFMGANSALVRSAPLPPQWWRLYQDPVLDRLVKQAFNANTDLRIAAANLARAQAVLEQTRSAELPAVELTAGPGYGRPSAAALLAPERLKNAWLYDTGANISYTLDLVGKIKRAVEAASDDIDAAQAGADLAHVSVAAATTLAYVNTCSAGQDMLVAQHAIDLQQRSVALTSRRVLAGRGSALDNTRAAAQLDQLRAALPPLIAARITAQYRLAVLTGELPGTLPADVTGCEVAPQLRAPVPVGNGADLLRRRPDIRQAERQLAAATARIGVATAELYPSITLGLSAGSTGALAEFGASNASRWNIGPLISWTIPSNGAARSRIAQADAASNAALAHFDGVVLNALREVESALTVYAQELDRNAALRSARDQSALAFMQARTLYQSGRTDALTALDTDRTLATTEITLAASDAQLSADQVALFLALGGGWDAQNDGGAK